MVNIWFS